MDRKCSWLLHSKPSGSPSHHLQQRYHRPSGTLLEKLDASSLSAPSTEKGDRGGSEDVGAGSASGFSPSHRKKKSFV